MSNEFTVRLDPVAGLSEEDMARVESFSIGESFEFTEANVPEWATELAQVIDRMVA
jgi:hypothetical protein